MATMTAALQSNGYAVIDSALSNPAAAMALKQEVLEAKLAGLLVPSKIGGGKHNEALRGDLVGWFDGKGDEWETLANWLRVADGVAGADSCCADVLLLMFFLVFAEIHTADCNRQIPELQEVSWEPFCQPNPNLRIAPLKSLV